MDAQSGQAPVSKGMGDFEMKCIEAQQLVKPYIKRQLSDREMEGFLEHVEHCPECYDELEIYFVIYETMEDSSDEGGRDQYNFQEKLQQDMKSAKRYLYLRKAYRFFRTAVILAAELLLICTVITGVEMLGEEGTQGTTIYRVMYGLHGQGVAPRETEDVVPPKLQTEETEEMVSVPLPLPGQTNKMETESETEKE